MTFIECKQAARADALRTGESQAVISAAGFFRMPLHLAIRQQHKVVYKAIVVRTPNGTMTERHIVEA